MNSRATRLFTKTFFVVCLLVCVVAIKCADWAAPTLTWLLMSVSLLVHLSARCQDSANLPEGASTPALGLSNKAVFQGKILAQLCM